MDDLIGADDYVLSGSDLLELGIDPAAVGARARRTKRKADRRYVLGLTTVTATGQMTGSPNLDFRPDRLVLVDSVANNTTVSSIKSGNVDQMIGGSVPAAMFSPTAINTALVGQTIKANTQVSVSVTLAAAGNCSGGFIGLADQ